MVTEVLVALLLIADVQSKGSDDMDITIVLYMWIEPSCEELSAMSSLRSSLSAMLYGDPCHWSTEVGEKTRHGSTVDDDRCENQC